MIPDWSHTGLIQFEHNAVSDTDILKLDISW